MIPRISNLILTIPIRVNHAICPRERERAPNRANAAEARILETVALAGRHVAAEWSLRIRVRVVRHAFAGGVVAGSSGLEDVAVPFSERVGVGVGGGGMGGRAEDE